MGGLEDRDRPQLLSFKSNTDFIKHLLVLKKKRTNIKRCFYGNENVYDNFYFFCYISLQHLIIYITVNVTVIICFGV